MAGRRPASGKAQVHERKAAWPLIALAVALAAASAAPIVAPARASAHQEPCVAGATRLAAPPLPPRVQHALVADGVGRLYVFGGGSRLRDRVGYVVDGPALGDFWSYDLSDGRWLPLSTADGPPPLVEPHLARDRAGFVYEFGGWSEGPVGYSGRLYRYDPARDRWTALDPPGPRPVGRVDCGFAWEPLTDQIYLFAGGADDGHGGERLLNDFWRYDPTSNRWTDLTVSSGAGAITPREIYNITADGEGHLYLFAGSATVDGVGWEAIQDLWRFDIRTGRWQNLTDVTNTRSVPPRHYYGQAVDGDGAFYVVGGVRPGSIQPMTDAWRFDPLQERWSEVSTLFDALLPLIPYNLAYDPAADALFTVGGMQPDGMAGNDVYRVQLCAAGPRPGPGPGPAARGVAGDSWQVLVPRAGR